jgi:hypothetical protein
MPDDQLREAVQELGKRVQRLEQFSGISAWQPRPGFNPLQFQRILLGYLTPFFVLLLLPLFTQVAIVFQGRVSEERFFGLPLWNVAGEPSFLGLPLGIVAVGGGAIGLISFGGLAIGGLAFGGGAFGVVAVGGGAVGLIALGGGSLGLIALGGGACGYVAVGGGAYGVYVLAGEGHGKYVFDRRRQDEEAVRFFCKLLPRLRQAFTSDAA